MCIHHLQDGLTAMDLTSDVATFMCLRAAGAKMPEFTDENKNTLLLEYARDGRAGHVRAVLEAGANAHTHEVHVCARSESGGMRVSGVHVWVCVCVRSRICTVCLVHSYVRYTYECVCVCV